MTPRDDVAASGREVDRRRAVLASALQKAGLQITPELSAKIDALATNYATAASAGDKLKESQQNIVQKQQELNALGRGVLGGIIDDLRAGKNASDIFADALGKIANKLEDIALNALFPTSGKGGILGGLFSGGGKGGLLGGILIPGILHEGGVAGRDGYGHGRAVPSLVFAGARRYHIGGLAGLNPGEVPAILQRGEVVIPKGARSAPSGGGSLAVHVTSEVRNGNMVPTMVQISGTVAGQQIRQANKVLPQRLTVQQKRGV